MSIQLYFISFGAALALSGCTSTSEVSPQASVQSIPNFTPEGLDLPPYSNATKAQHVYFVGCGTLRVGCVLIPSDGNLSLLEALDRIGGLNRYGSYGVLLYRFSERGELQETMKIDVRKIGKTEILLKPNDIIFTKEAFVSEFRPGSSLF